jgi:hypothetical protein
MMERSSRRHMNKKVRIIIGLCILAILIVVLIICSRSVSVRPISQETEAKLSGDSNVLVVYFSYSGNTQTVARDVQETTNADIFRITVVDEYPDSYNAMSDRTGEEKASQARPELKDKFSHQRKP